jgi:hypothetical protein
MSEQMMFLPGSLIQAVAPDRGTQPREQTVHYRISYASTAAEFEYVNTAKMRNGLSVPCSQRQENVW